MLQTVSEVGLNLSQDCVRGTGCRRHSVQANSNLEAMHSLQTSLETTQGEKCERFSCFQTAIISNNVRHKGFFSISREQST